MCFTAGVSWLGRTIGLVTSFVCGACAGAPPPAAPMDEGPPALCARGGDDRVRDVFCEPAAEPPNSLRTLEDRLGLRFSAPPLGAGRAAYPNTIGLASATSSASDASVERLAGAGARAAGARRAAAHVRITLTASDDRNGRS